MRRMAPHPDDSPDRVRLEVGLQLRFHRHRARLSQTQVAAATGWSLSAISMYEQGNRQAGYAKLRRLAELYGCTVDDFFTDGHDPAAERLQQLEARVAELERLLDRSPARARVARRALEDPRVGAGGARSRPGLLSDLSRFVDAQARVYDDALSELRAGRKTSHWMWFVFPQIAGLGRSPTAQRYAIASLAEAEAYVAHPVLGQRLRECARVLTRAGGPQRRAGASAGSTR